MNLKSLKLFLFFYLTIALCSEDNIIELNTKGGVLTVSFDEFNGCYKNIWLTGEVNLVYIGEFEC